MPFGSTHKEHRRFVVCELWITYNRYAFQYR